MNPEKHLKIFPGNGEIPIDNSATEAAIQLFTIGRSRRHINSNIYSAQARAIIFSLERPAKANNLL